MKSFLTLASLILLAGCMASPLPRTYVLATPAEPDPGVINEAGRPMIELPTVALPDYLDSTDILVRNGQNELTPSTTGRWGERLSLGITHALEVALARQLPGVLVTHTSVPGQPSVSLLVNVEAFDVHPDGQCVLTARWMIPGDDGQPTTISQQGTFVTKAAVSTSGPPTDAAIVSAMAASVDQLADRIAMSLRRSSARPR
ncbi:MAG: PqiC family protein [Acetobacteraceae bacterium]|jgi:uncharacterized lipoprotein YmbA